MEQVSIQKMLAFIPSTASNFAMACVGQILEDHIEDPKKMAKKLKRIGSVVSEWGLSLSRDIDEKGDGGKLFSRFYRTQSATVNPALLNLPSKIRRQIWSCLGNKDLLNVRLVCSKVQFDVDYLVGLPVILDTSCESIKWLQSITTRDCYVKHMKSFLYFNFLPLPERMEILRFHEHLTIPPEMLDLVLRKFSSVRRVTFHSQELLEVSNGQEIKPVLPSITTELLSVLERRDRPMGISMHFNELTLTTEWDLEFNLKRNPTHFNVYKVNFQIPCSKLHQQKDCLQYLERQNSIVDLEIDFPGISLEQYVPIIYQNANTMRRLYLLNISSTGSPFDCNILKKCQNLHILCVSGETNNNGTTDGFSYLPMVDIRALSLPKLQEIHLDNVYISAEDYSFIKLEFSKTVWIKKCLCGVEKVLEAKTGVRRLNDPFESQDNWNEDSETNSSDVELNYMSLDYYENENIGRKDSVTKFIQGIPVEVLKGVILTAWITFC